MIWNRHSALEGQHAFLGASKPSWLNYDEDKLARVFTTQRAAALGTRRHALAAELISLGEKLPRQKRTLNMYVNDCIGFRMEPEMVLRYSRNCYGTADAVSYRTNELRIFDLKTGEALSDPRQLQIYAALFFLEYGRELNADPFNTKMDLRIYQSNMIKPVNNDPDVIVHVMDDIKLKDRWVDDMRWEDER